MAHELNVWLFDKLAGTLSLAHAMQLQPARSSMHHVLGRSFLLVERYDRLTDAQGQLQRLNQEDFCQTLGVVSAMKYQNEGGLTLPQCVELLRSRHPLQRPPGVAPA